MDARRIINGTHGELWLDDDFVHECYGMQAKISVEKETVPMCGQMGQDSKLIGWKGTGSLKFNKVNTRMGNLIGQALREGRDLRFKIISKLDDPDAYGAERVAIRSVSFDDLTLANWEDKKAGKVEVPFTFTDFEFLDKIDA